MYHRELVKSKTAAKSITLEKEKLKNVILNTMDQASQLVGSTLGPNGKVVLVERQENLPPYVTKDGISVFNTMAFTDPTAQAVLEAARDSSSKTNVEAGDGTTTATILAESLIRLGFEHIEKNPRLSVQKIMRELEQVYNNVIVPFVKQYSIKITNENDNDLLKKVAMIATNSDEEMSDAVIEAFNLVGHNGNITIAETSGVSGFGVERIEGYPIPRGFEDSCGRFLEEFINDKANYRTVLEKPQFILYNGQINDVSTILPILQKIVVETGLDDPNREVKTNVSPNIVFVAHGFSDTVLAFFAQNFKNPETLNMVPLKTPLSQQANGQYHFLLDLSAFTGAKVFDPLTCSLDKAEVSDLGQMAMFEFYRYRSLILGNPQEADVIMRVEELAQQVKQAESSLDRELLQERMGLLTGGIARVKVFGSSDSELKEKKHRVEDAVMAVKGALKEGVLPGCGKTLLTLSALIKGSNSSDSVKEILGKALIKPFERIFKNGGLNNEEIEDVYKNMMNKDKDFFHTFDALNLKYGDAIELGVVDSASAVLMAIKNSLAVAKMLMGLSGIVVFKRDFETEVSEGKSYDAERQAISEALERRKKEEFEVPY